MSADQSFKEFDRHLQPRERGFPQLALRRRASDHPMVMFAVIVAAAFASMALVSSPGLASVSFSKPAPAKVTGVATAKADRLPLRETDVACKGQAWGAESEACLVAIARQAGKHDMRSIRLVAIAELATTAPNIF